MNYAETIAYFGLKGRSLRGLKPKNVVTNPVFNILPSPVVTFTHLGANYIRTVAFGGVNASWQESGQEARAYLTANAAAWGEI